MRHLDDGGQAREVRRCARCGAAALACIRAWRHRVLGVDTSMWTLELGCQSCGAEVTLHPPKKIALERIFAILLVPTIVGSLIFFARARANARAWRDNPVVAAVAAPARRVPPTRRCACRGGAACSEMGRRQVLGVAIGTRFRHTCDHCGRVFTVHDVRAVVATSVLASVLTALGALIVIHPPGSDVGAAASNRWFGMALLVLAAIAWIAVPRRIRARRAHPIVP